MLSFDIRPSKASSTFWRPYLDKFVVDLPIDNEASITFCMTDLTSYLKDEHLVGLRTTNSTRGE